MRWNSFFPGLAFAAVAAAGVAPFTLVFAPALGWSSSLTAYGILSVSVYLAGAGPTLRRGWLAGLLAGAVGGLAWAVAPSPRDAIFAAALALALGRSGLIYRARFARALAIEGALGVAALGIASHLWTGSLFSAALATWSFFLVHSAYFLFGGRKVRNTGRGGLDPFEAARMRALEILESPPTPVP